MRSNPAPPPARRDERKLRCHSDNAPDFTAIKAKQNAAWASGDYAIVGTTLQIVGEALAEAVDIRSGQQVLDVAAGNGNFTLAAARRWADVTSTDYVGHLLDRGAKRAEAEGLAVTFQLSDAEALPFADASFDVVGSTYGVMFTPEPGPGRRRTDAGVPVRRQDRARQLDARGLHRPVVQGHRSLRAAAGRRAVSGTVGHPRPA